MKRFARLILALSRSFNVLAGVAMCFVLAVSVADIIMNKAFKDPLNWAFDSIGLVAVLATACAIPQVQVEHGHIEVDILVNRFSKFWKRITAIFVNLLGLALWAIIAWRSLLYGLDILEAGEVSMSVGMLIYPFIFIQGLCALLVALVLLAQILVNNHLADKWNR